MDAPNSLKVNHAVVDEASRERKIRRVGVSGETCLVGKHQSREHRTRRVGNSREAAMPVTVKKIVLWRTEVDNKPGALASTIEAPAKAGADLKIIMGYRHPAAAGRAVIEVFPIVGKKGVTAAGAAGLSAAAIPTLLVEGENKPGLGHSIAQALAAAGINIAFFVAQVIGSKFAAVIGFETEDDAENATPMIKKAARGVRA